MPLRRGIIAVSWADMTTGSIQAIELRTNPRGAMVTAQTRIRRDWERVFSEWSKPPRLSHRSHPLGKSALREMDFLSASPQTPSHGLWPRSLYPQYLAGANPILRTRAIY